MPLSSLSAALQQPKQASHAIAAAKAIAAGPDLRVFPCLAPVDGPVDIQITAGDVEGMVLYGLHQGHQQQSQSVPFKPSNASQTAKSPGQVWPFPTPA